MLLEQRDTIKHRRISIGPSCRGHIVRLNGCADFLYHLWELVTGKCSVCTELTCCSQLVFHGIIAES